MSALSNFSMLTKLGWTAFDVEDSKARDQVAVAAIGVSFKLLNETKNSAGYEAYELNPGI